MLFVTVNVKDSMEGCIANQVNSSYGEMYPKQLLFSYTVNALILACIQLAAGLEHWPGLAVGGVN